MTPLFTAGNSRLAYYVSGNGAPLVVVPAWISHFEYDGLLPETRSYYQRLGARRRLIRYDKRGTGLSDRHVTDESYTVERQVADLAGGDPPSPC
jgi:pimeloyl-ACP methyl ester carboxylesterase